MATRNRAQYLRDCLATLATQQTERPFEVVIVDNDSTDDTAAVVAQWCRSDHRFRGVKEAQVGLSAAKNRGVRCAQGSLLLFTDDDVVANEHWIDSYQRFFSGQCDDERIAGGRIIPIPHDLGPWPDWFVDEALADVGLLDYGSERALDGREYVWGANMAVPARLFERHGAWDESLGRRGEERGTFEDTEFQDRARAGGVTVWFWPAATIHHRIDRRCVTPAQVVQTAFTRGRNSYWMDKLTRVQRRPGLLDLLCCGINLSRCLTVWLLWSGAFRLLRPVRGRFRRAHRAAFDAGRETEGIRERYGARRSGRALTRGAFGTRRLVLRLLRSVSL